MTLRRLTISIKHTALCAALLPIFVFGGCATDSRIATSAGHISEPAKRPAAEGIPQPVQLATQLPPPKPQVKQPTYSVVVTEVPVKELLFALARDTQLNIDVHPNIQGVVTLNAINETLPAILDRVANQVNIRYKLDGRTLIVTPDTPYLKTYKVDYVNLTRKTSSSIGVSTQVATTGSGATTSGSSAQSSAAGANSSATTVTSTSTNEFWEVLAANIRDLIKSTRSVSQSAEERNARIEAARAAREDRLQQATAVARAGQAAPNLFNAVFGAGAQTPLEEKKDDVIVNPVTGTVLVMATEAQQKLVQQYLDGLQSAANRQVLIEATIVAVQLKDEFKAGVDWNRAVGAGTGFYFNTTANLANALNPFATLTYYNARDNFTAAIKLLESFGSTRVLSSPKLMVLNNQTSMLKVVDNLVYFTIEVQQGTTSSTGLITQPTYTTTANTVPVGVVMSVTPQINDNGRVTLVVRPTISRKVGEVSDPNPALTQGANRIENKVPVIQVSEMESVLQVPSGETVVLGGLMQDDSARNSDTLPGLTDTPFNYLFGQKERKVQQTELVIFIRPTNIPNPSLSSEELSFYRRYLPQAPSEAPVPTTP
jgi:general secretion pathway protein D